MRRLVLCLAAAVAALVFVPAAFADGPMFVTVDGSGVGHGSLRYVAANTTSGHGTDVVEVSTRSGSVGPALRLRGSWGLPYTAAGEEGLSHDGRTLVLGAAGVGLSSPTRFLVVNARQMKVERTISLPGYFSYDALSPDASRLYLIQYTQGRTQNTSRYVVREFDLRTNRLLPGKIAARSDADEKKMSGYAVTRTTSADGRWVYTLYQKPSGMPFIHALDTVGGKAYCIDLPANGALYNIVLSLQHGGRTLACTGGAGGPGCAWPPAVGASRSPAAADSRGRGPARGSAPGSRCSPPWPAASYSCSAGAARKSRSARDTSSGSRSVT